MAKWKKVVDEIFRDIVKDWKNEDLFKQGVNTKFLENELSERIEIRRVSKKINGVDKGQGIGWSAMQEIGFTEKVLKRALEMGMVYESRPGRFRSLTE